MGYVAWQALLVFLTWAALLALLARLLIWGFRRALGLAPSQQSWQIVQILFPAFTRWVATAGWRALNTPSPLPMVAPSRFPSENRSRQLLAPPSP